MVNQKISQTPTGFVKKLWAYDDDDDDDDDDDEPIITSNVTGRHRGLKQTYVKTHASEYRFKNGNK